MKEPEEEEEDQESEPLYDPEPCGEGRDGIDCDPQWEDGGWVCSTCGEHI